MAEKAFNFTDLIATLAVSALCTPFATWILDRICYHQLTLSRKDYVSIMLHRYNNSNSKNDL